MGHHPPVGVQPVITANVVNTSDGLSSMTWFLIVIGACIIGYFIYKFVKNR